MVKRAAISAHTHTHACIRGCTYKYMCMIYVCAHTNTGHKICRVKAHRAETGPAHWVWASGLSSTHIHIHTCIRDCTSKYMCIIYVCAHTNAGHKICRVKAHRAQGRPAHWGGQAERGYMDRAPLLPHGQEHRCVDKRVYTCV